MGMPGRHRPELVTGFVILHVNILIFYRALGTVGRESCALLVTAANNSSSFLRGLGGPLNCEKVSYSTDTAWGHGEGS